MPLSPEQIDDIVSTTLPILGRGDITDIYPDLQEYTAMGRLLDKGKRLEADGGYKIDWRVKVSNGSQARWTGLYDIDDPQVNNMVKVASVPWSMADTHFAYDNREEVFNRGSAAIYDMLELRVGEAMQSWAELAESGFWGLPDTSNNKKPYGVQYWLVKNATEGFNGGNPSGFSDVAGLSRTTYPHWKNWTAQYAAVSKTDLLKKARKAARYTKFKPAYKLKGQQTGDSHAHYTNYTVLGQLEEYLQTENENLGNDVAHYDGRVMFRGAPVDWVPHLDSDATNPWYGINWTYFHVLCAQNQFMKENKPSPTASHAGRAVYYDMIMQIRNKDPRRSFVLATA